MLGGESGSMRGEDGFKDMRHGCLFDPASHWSAVCAASHEAVSG
jgi:hypothetical protein